MFFLLLIICIVLSYFILSYLFLTSIEQKVFKFQNMLFEYSDKRFSTFEDLINKSLNFLKYEQTFLPDIVQLRSQATKAKQEDDIRAVFFFEEKISQLALRINILFAEFPILNKIEDAEKIQAEIIEMEKSLLEMKNKYNQLVIDYNKLKSHVFFIPVTRVFERFDEQIEFWKITTTA